MLKRQKVSHCSFFVLQQFPVIYLVFHMYLKMWKKYYYLKIKIRTILMESQFCVACIWSCYISKIFINNFIIYHCYVCSTDSTDEISNEPGSDKDFAYIFPGSWWYFVYNGHQNLKRIMIRIITVVVHRFNSFIVPQHNIHGWLL